MSKKQEIRIEIEHKNGIISRMDFSWDDNKLFWQKRKIRELLTRFEQNAPSFEIKYFYGNLGLKFNWKEKLTYILSIIGEDTSFNLFY